MTRPAFAAPSVAPLTSTHCKRTSTCHHVKRGRFPLALSPRMAVSEPRAPGTTAVPAKYVGAPTKVPGSLAVFASYFAAMSGQWNSERTYHYVRERRRESSQTTFDVNRLKSTEIDAVLASNGEAALLDPRERAYSEGFSVGFLTRMESQVSLVRASTNLVFVPRDVTDSIVSGDYYRDLGYEEKSPIAALFSFNARAMELTMTTRYTRVVSVDQISLVNPKMRLRKIVNYARPESDSDPLVDPILVGFGVESKGDDDRLVKPFA